MHHIPALILKAELAELKRPLSEPHGYSLSRVSVTLAHEYLLPLTTSICYPLHRHPTPAADNRHKVSATGLAQTDELYPLQDTTKHKKSGYNRFIRSHPLFQISDGLFSL